MPIFLGLIVAPGLALACQGVMLMLVSPSCANQTRAAVHLVALLFLALDVGLALLAARDWRLQRAAAGGGSERLFGSRETRRFLAACATAVAALSALVIVMMWFSAWVLWPCSE